MIIHFQNVILWIDLMLLKYFALWFELLLPRSAEDAYVNVPYLLVFLMYFAHEVSKIL